MIEEINQEVKKTDKDKTLKKKLRQLKTQEGKYKGEEANIQVTTIKIRN